MKKTIELKFNGYWRDVNKSGVPDKSGIYVVYTCKHNKEAKTVSLKKLVYIGEAGDVRKRITEEHEKRECWEGELESGEVLCFSFAPASKADRERAEAALIFKKKPKCNDQGKDSFTYDETTVKNTGKHKFISEEFTVKKTE